MNNKLIEQIKEIKGVKTISGVNAQFPNSENMVIVTFEPEKPVIHDEYGVPMCDGDHYFWVGTNKNIKWCYYNVITNISCVIEPSVLDELKNYKIFASYESAKKWVAENKPKPLYIDPETGEMFFEGDEVCWFNKINYSITSRKFCKNNLQEGVYASKVYKTRKYCEIALANFILNKYK